MANKGKKPLGRPPAELSRLNTTPEKLAKELLKQRPLVDVEQERKGRSG